MSSSSPTDSASLPGWLWVPRLTAAGVLIRGLAQRGPSGGSAEALGSLVIEGVALVLLLLRPGMGGLLTALLMGGAVLRQLESRGGFELALASVGLACAAVVWWRDRQRCTL
ncbi:MAG: hypothetical protein O2799_00100 [Planctomycetota bacterium]|nr:hypothetical protein [Planctomycetota bacterium]